MSPIYPYNFHFQQISFIGVVTKTTISWWGILTFSQHCKYGQSAIIRLYVTFKKKKKSIACKKWTIQLLVEMVDFLKTNWILSSMFFSIATIAEILKNVPTAKNLNYLALYFPNHYTTLSKLVSCQPTLGEWFKLLANVYPNPWLSKVPVCVWHVLDNQGSNVFLIKLYNLSCNTNMSTCKVNIRPSEGILALRTEIGSSSQGHIFQYGPYFISYQGL